MTNDAAVAWIEDLTAVLDASINASATPLVWIANEDFSPEQTKAWLCETVENTVAADAFSGSLHGIAEDETGHVVAFTGCGPTSAANAKFLIWCVHFVLKHKESLIADATTVADLRADVVSTNARCIELGERIARLADLRASDAAYIKKLDGIIEETGVRPVSCINPYEDLKAVVLWQKKRIESLESAPDGSWLWGKLMDWCRAQGVSPATQDSLLAIATEAHRRAALTKDSP